jgi:hypothetical protein
MRRGFERYRLRHDRKQLGLRTNELYKQKSYGMSWFRSMNSVRRMGVGPT